MAINKVLLKIKSELLRNDFIEDRWGHFKKEYLGNKSGTIYSTRVVLNKTSFRFEALNTLKEWKRVKSGYYCNLGEQLNLAGIMLNLRK
jgi:hypothetical protein